jgi:hypothetical protein
MNPRTPKLLVDVITLAERIIKDDHWKHYQELCALLPLQTADVATARAWPREAGEKPLVNDTTMMLLECCAVILRTGPFGDAAYATRFRYLAGAFLGHVKTDAAMAIDLSVRPTA